MAQKYVLFLYSLTPVHPGSGTSVAYVDLPVQRERITNFPIIQSSGVKGVIRAEAVAKIRSRQAGLSVHEVATLFGPGEDLKEWGGETDASKHSGCISFTDAKVLLFPVRSLSGVFAYITCPQVLQRFNRDIALSSPNQKIPVNFTVPQDECFVGKESALKVTSEQIVLEEFVFKSNDSKSKEVQDIADWLKVNALKSEPLATDLEKRLAIVSDDVFRDFVSFSTEIVSRTRIDQITGTVAPGALWDEEMLPSETLFWSLCIVDQPRGNPPESVNTVKNASEKFSSLIPDGTILQIGGDETLGRGLMRTQLFPRQGGESK
ncbi:MAG: type III-B CRISPR module RAMP protein Cmr4 [bacterium JZ-2024 1]